MILENEHTAPVSWSLCLEYSQKAPSTRESTNLRSHRLSQYIRRYFVFQGLKIIDLLAMYQTGGVENFVS